MGKEFVRQAGGTGGRAEGIKSRAKSVPFYYIK